MNYTIDQYIRQSLKNWTAQHTPPSAGRTRLLLMASSYKSCKQEVLKKRIERNEYIAPFRQERLKAELAIESVTQAHLWWFFNAPLRNMA